MGNVNPVAARLHDLVARRVVPPLHFASRVMRPGFRPAAIHFRDGLRFRAGAVGWSEERRREWILGRLREAVRRAAAIPFHAERFAAAGFDPRADFSFADYATLPPLEREEVREAGRALVSPDVPAAQIRKDATGGSTGTPTTIWTGPRERGWRESGIEHYMRRIGLPAGSRVGMLWGHHLDPIARSSVRERAQDWIRNLRWYDCLRLSDEVLAGYHRELQAWRPDALVCYASSLAALADAAAAAGDRPAYPKRAFVTGAEKVFAHQRERIEAVYGKPVVERYGARDVGLIAFQSGAPRMDDPHRLDFEVDWANAFVEPETEGDTASILVTKLNADAMPMLRYRIGDVARFPAGARPGEPATRLLEVIGRDVDRVWLPDGRWMNGLAFPHLLKDFPIEDFQVVQGADYAVEVRVVASPAWTDAAGERIASIVRANVPGLPVAVRTVDSIPRTKANKWQPVVTAVRGGRASAVLADSETVGT